MSPVGTVQFHMPRATADALPIGGIAAEARNAGLEDATLQYSNTRWRLAETIVTCQMPVAEFLLERLLAADAQRGGDETLRSAPSAALGAALEAIAHPYSPEATPAEETRQQLSWPT